MKQNIIFSLLFMLSFLSYSQNHNILIEYEYKSNFVQRVETLIANNTQAVNIKEAIDHINENNVEWDESQNSIYLNPKRIKLNADTFYLERGNNTIYMAQEHKGKPSIIKDILPDDYNWDISHTDTKEIGGFICKKATTNFRGTDIEAWYTEEISIAFGPGKFKGLPGLILELYSVNDPSSNDYWIAKKVVFPYTEEINFNYDQDLPLVLYKDIIIKQEEQAMEIMRRSQTRAPKGITTSAPSKLIRVGVEKVFEWEEVDTENESKQEFRIINK